MLDSLTPFMLNNAPVRGRCVRLGQVVDNILSRHQYPDLVSSTLAETLVVAAILASNLKQDGVFTIQVQSKGAISLLVVDAAYGGALRGYAQFDEEAVSQAESDLPSLFGEGYLAITLDPGEGAQRYQGVVPLEGNSIPEAVQLYFSQSQQLDIQLHCAVGKLSGADSDYQGWLASGIYIEKMPDEKEADEDAWPRAKALLSTLQDQELLTTTLSTSDLLHRLYHEDGVWVYDEHPMIDGCRCSREKIENTLKTMQASALEEMAVDGEIGVTCQFCNQTESFALDSVKQSASE
ncbi:MAG: Hsp33 family molecular chaperone HslO [Rickettsiales bacterium]|nr:Hsp33 family molecular chaperone HslO [Rickettsiales bacterium]